MTKFSIQNHYLADEDAQRLYEAHPKLRASYKDYCPTCGKTETYRWQGEVTEDHEAQLVIKTTGSRLDAAIARVQVLHPYELPECIAVETRAGLPAYLDWIRAQTREEND